MWNLVNGNRYCSRKCYNEARIENPQKRFFKKVKKTKTCWIWIGSKSDGYGYLRIKREIKRAHRLSYEWFIGPIPNKLLICHSCDNPACVNPKHLWIGTDRDNARDRSRKGRNKHYSIK